MYIIKQNSGFVCNCFKNFKPEGFDLLETTQEQVNKLKSKEIMWNNGELVKNPEYDLIFKSKEDLIYKKKIKLKINQLKHDIAASDYKILKYFEGQLSMEEYIAAQYQRQEIRKQINLLEEELNG